MTRLAALILAFLGEIVCESSFSVSLQSGGRLSDSKRLDFNGAVMLERLLYCLKKRFSNNISTNLIFTFQHLPKLKVHYPGQLPHMNQFTVCHWEKLQYFNLKAKYINITIQNISWLVWLSGVCQPGDACILESIKKCGIQKC